MANNPAGSFLILARGRFEPARLEALALEHGAQVTEYQGKRLITHHDNDDGDADHDDMAFGFLEADLVAFGSIELGEGAIDARAANRNVVSNNEMMKLVNEIDNANAWAVGTLRRHCEQGRYPERDRLADAEHLVVLGGGPRQRRRQRHVQGRSAGRGDRARTCAT